METKTTSTNAAQKQSVTNNRSVTFDYLNKTKDSNFDGQQQDRPRGGRAQGDFQD